MTRHVPGRAMLGAAVLVFVGACNSAAAPTASTPTAPTPASSREGVATPSPAWSPSPYAPTGALSAAAIDKVLVGGTYRVADPFGVPFDVTLPNDWQLKDIKEGDTELATTPDGEHYPAWIVVDLVDNVFADPCKSTGPVDPPVASNPGAIVEALTHMAGYIAGPVKNVTVGSHRGKAVVVTNDIDTKAAGCVGSLMLPMWTFRGGGDAATNGHAREQLRVIDVDGVTVIIDGESFENTPHALVNQVDRIVNGITFE